MTQSRLFPQQTSMPLALLDTTVWKMLLPAMSRSWPTPPSYNTRGYVEFLTRGYNRPGFFSHPESFFELPFRAPKVEVTKVRDLPGGGEVVDLCFESNYEPFFSEYSDHASLYPENQQVRARWYRSSEPRKTMIALHGLGSGHYHYDSATFDAMRWWEAGLDVVLPILPHHGSRRAAGAPKGAMLFPSSDLVRTNESFRQAVWDIRNLIFWLEQHFVPSFGLMGLSLGGYVSALLASLLDGLEFVWLLCPAVSISHVMWMDKQRNLTLQIAERSGVTRDQLDALFAVHSPLWRKCRVPPGRRHIILAGSDRITPAQQALPLWDHWDRPDLHWIPGSHVAQVGRDRVYDDLERWLKDAGIAPGSQRTRFSSLVRYFSMPSVPGLQINVGELGAQTVSRLIRRSEPPKATKGKGLVG